MKKEVRSKIISSPKKSVPKQVKKDEFLPVEKITLVQKISEQDKINRLAFCSLIHDNYRSIENNILKSIRLT